MNHQFQPGQAVMILWSHAQDADSWEAEGLAEDCEICITGGKHEIEESPTEPDERAVIVEVLEDSDRLFGPDVSVYAEHSGAHLLRGHKLSLASEYHPTPEEPEPPPTSPQKPPPPPDRDGPELLKEAWS